MKFFLCYFFSLSKKERNHLYSLGFFNIFSDNRIIFPRQLKGWRSWRIFRYLYEIPMKFGKMNQNGLRNDKKDRRFGRRLEKGLRYRLGYRLSGVSEDDLGWGLKDSLSGVLNHRWKRSKIVETNMKMSKNG